MNQDRGSVPSLLKECASQTFLSLLRQIDGTKDIVISAQLIPILDLLCGFNILKENGVDKIYKLESTSPNWSPIKKRCYVIKNNVEEARTVANHLNSSELASNDLSSPIKKSISHLGAAKVWIIFVPRLLHVCEELLEKEGVYGLFNILEFPIGFIPLDADLFSLEDADFFSDCFLEGDQTSLYRVANALAQLQQLLGEIPYIYSQGKYSKMIYTLMNQIQESSAFNQRSEGRGAARSAIIRNIVMIDRDVDFPSVLLSQLNYEGLLDETFGISCGKVEFPPEVNKGVKSKHPANSSDPIFRDIRDSHFSSVFVRLKEKGKLMKAKYQERKNMNLSDMKEFIANELKVLQAQHASLALHISACEYIMEDKKRCDFVDLLHTEQNLIEGRQVKECMQFVEELIIRQIDPLICLRLLCLLSITQDGLPRKSYEQLYQQFLQSYGYEHISTLLSLKKLGLFVEQQSITEKRLNLTSPTNSSYLSPSLGSLTAQLSPNILANMANFTAKKSQFKSVCKKFHLVPSNQDSQYSVKSPQDPGYVFGGSYIPLICRIVDILVSGHNPSASYSSTSSALPMSPSSTDIGGINKAANVEELMKTLPGDFFQYKRGSSTISVGPSSASSISTPHIPTEADRKNVLILIVGGITFAEVSALRFQAAKRGLQALICSTSVVNGNSILRQTFPKAI